MLTRKVGEAITISDYIEVSVLEIKGEQIKLGIKAPKEVEIHRKEVYDNIQNENKRAMSTSEQLDKLLD